MGEEGSSKITAATTIATFVLFFVFVVVGVVCIVPNLYWIEHNTANLNDGSHISDQLNTLHHDISSLDGDINQLHEDIVTLHKDLKVMIGQLNLAAEVLVAIRDK